MHCVGFILSSNIIEVVTRVKLWIKRNTKEDQHKDEKNLTLTLTVMFDK